MSQLLNSGKVGTLDKDRMSNKHIQDRWKNIGLLDNIDEDTSVMVALAMEVAANFMLMERISCDIMHNINGAIFNENNRFETVVFPIVARIIRKTPEAVNFIPEIINDAKKQYNTPIAKVIHEKEVPERHLKYLYDNILIKWAKYHKSRYKNYEEFKKGVYNDYVKRQQNWGREIEPFDANRFVDWEAEYCAALAEKIETEIREKLKIER